MSWIELFLIATGLSMDAFAVSICKGLAMKRCTLGKAGIVGLYFGGFQALMGCDHIGGSLDRIYPPWRYRRKYDPGSAWAGSV